MSRINLTYFTCTLGEATLDGVSRPYRNVNQLIEVQAVQNPNLPAIGFYDTSGRDGTVHFYVPKILTYREVCDGVLTTAVLLRKTLSLSQGDTIALLADSSPAFLFTWLGGIRLGLAVLLIAPQCSASAVANLCQACNVDTLLTDEKHEELASKACNSDASPGGGGRLKNMLLPFRFDEDVFEAISPSDRKAELAMPDTHDEDVAYLHHTSGTSSGIPKPIPQTHHGAVGVLPALDGRSRATFTTTPLYHGGPADIFRAWSSSGMIWMFPSQAVPVTPANIIKCLRATEDGSYGYTCPTRYFTSVPYILQMMAADDEGLSWLQKMDLVGVGGAALPVQIGDQLVRDGVRLVSRFGSAECGFLLSSHRDYENDTDWQYLRLNDSVAQIEFESREGDLSELVVKSDWPHMAKRNREDGSYATSDLFASHPSIPRAFKYHSRADSQLTLVTGKKFDPAPLEDAIVASSTLISNAFIFGNGKPYPGVLIFKSQEAREMQDDTVLDAIVKIMENLNMESQSHARIPRNMLLIMPHDDQALEKSSKGTILRSQAEERYSASIDGSYDKTGEDLSSNIADDVVETIIMDSIKSLIDADADNDIQSDSDLFSHGIDSVACLQIRHSLSRLLPKDAKTLPLTVVEDSRTIAGLTDFILRARRGKDVKKSSEGNAEIPRLVEQYSRLKPRPGQNKAARLSVSEKSNDRLTVLMTGPTGSLGSHVLSCLLQSSRIAKVYLLVRGATTQAAKERVLKALSARKLPIPSDFDHRIIVIQSKLSDVDLGLSKQQYTLLQESVDLILHLAWSVNFLLSLGSFAPHFAGIQSLLNLCLSTSKNIPPKLIFCSSVASVSAFQDLRSPSTNVPEEIVPSTIVSGPTGYAQSKLTAELILGRAPMLYPALKGRVAIVRVGQLSADNLNGVWNKSEAYPQVLASSKFTDGVLPDLGEEERLTWLPVNMAAKAYVEASLAEESVMANLPTSHILHKAEQRPNTKACVRRGSVQEKFEIDKNAVRVLHLLNPDHRFSFTDFILSLQYHLSLRDSQSTEQKVSKNDSCIKIVSAGQWLDHLEILQKTSHESAVQQLLRLLPFWKQAYANRQLCLQDQSMSKKDDGSLSTLNFDMHNSLLTMPSLAYWLGKSTPEVKRMKPNNSSFEAKTVMTINPSNPTYSSNESGQLNGIQTNRHCQQTSQGKRDQEVAELLSAEYVLRTWNWILANVP